MKPAIASIAALPLLLGACAGGNRLTPYFAAKEPVTANYIGVQTASLECEGEKDLGVSMVPPLVSLAADFAVELGKELLKDMRDSRSAVYAATGLMDSECLPTATEEAISGTFEVSRKMIALTDEGVMDPAFQLQGTITLTRIGKEDKDAKLHIHVEPTSFTYGRAAPRGGSKRKRVIVLLQISDGTALKAGEATGDLVLENPVRIDLGEVEEGFVYGGSKADDKSKVDDKSKLAHLASSMIMPLPTNPKPIVTALVVETEEESIALRALSTAYDDNTDSLTETLRSIFVKDSDSTD